MKIALNERLSGGEIWLKSLIQWVLLAFVTCIGIFLLSHLNKFVLMQEPDRLQLIVAHGVSLEGIASTLPGSEVVSETEGILSVPYGRVEEYKALALQESLVRMALGVPLDKMDLSIEHYWFHVTDQLHNYMNGDFGAVSGPGGNWEIPMTEALKGMLARSLGYFIPGLLLGLCLAFVLSIMASLWRGAGRLLDGLQALLVGLPDFFLVTILTFASIYCYKLTGQRLFHVAAFSDTVPFILPMLTIALVPGVLIYGTLRLAIQRELSRDYVVTARSKGLSAGEVLLNHVIRNVVEDLLTIMPKATNLALASMVVAEAFCDILGLGGTIVSPKLFGISAMPAACFMLAVISIVLHALYAWLRKRLVVRVGGVA
jgi:oligopeptide transport system permease protein